MKIHSVQHNFIMKSIMTASNVIVPLVVYPYVCRVLSPTGLGKVSFAQSVIYYFQIIALLGVPTYGIRACARVRDNKEELSRTVHEILFINLITGLVSFTLLFICMLAVPQIRSDRALFAVASLSVLCSLISCDWLYSGLEQYDFMTFASLGFKALMVAGTFLFVRSQSDYIIYEGMYILGTVGWGVVTFLSLPRYIFIRKLGGYNFRRHLKPIGVFFAMSIATTIYTQMDSTMIGFIRGTDENGFYDVAVKAKMAVVSVLTSLGAVLLPRSSYILEKGDRAAFFRMSSKALHFMLITSAAACVALILLAEPIVRIVAGGDFGNSVLPMQLIMPSIIFIAVTNVTGIQVMVPLGREKQVLYSEIAGAAVNLIINALLIPKLASSGAAIGTVAAEFAVLTVQIFAIKDILPDILHPGRETDGSNN